MTPYGHSRGVKIVGHPSVKYMTNVDSRLRLIPFSLLSHSTKIGHNCSLPFKKKLRKKDNFALHKAYQCLGINRVNIH